LRRAAPELKQDVDMIGAPAHDEGLAATIVDCTADDAEQFVPPGFVQSGLPGFSGEDGVDVNAAE
jgi:hypothetical protein